MHEQADGFEPLAMDQLGGLRILGACDNYTASSSGGAEKAAHEIYMRLGAAGAAVRVVSVPHGPVYDDPGVEIAPARGLDLSRFAGGYLCVSPDVFRVASRELAAFRPDVLHANTIHYNGCIALARLARKHSLPFVLTAQVGPLDQMPFVTRALATAYDRSIGRYIARRATKILAVSETVRSHMISLGARQDRVDVVENGVDHARFACDPMADDDDPLVLAVGRVVDNKGPQLLVDAAIELAGRMRVPRIGFLGDGPLRVELEARVKAAGLADRITFHGQVRDVERWMAQAQIVVRPSFTEGLPLAVLEAMSAGRLNIVSDIAPNKELIADGENGMTFRTGDSHSLAAALERAVTDQTLRHRLALEGRRTSLTRSWDRMAAETASTLTALTATSVVRR